MVLYGGGNEEQLYQNVIVMRHGPRLDNFEKSWTANADRPWDPPLYDGDEFKELFSDTAKKIREQLGAAPIHRVFVSPFLRCLQTASRTIEALSSGDIAPPKIKACVELGLAEMMNNVAIRVPPKDRDFKFVMSDCEAHLPSGTLGGHSTGERVYEKLPEWEETEEAARARYMHVVLTLADKHPRENLLLITHGEGILGMSSAFMRGCRVRADYCGYVHLRRPITNFTLHSHSGLKVRHSSSSSSSAAAWAYIHPVLSIFNILTMQYKHAWAYIRPVVSLFNILLMLYVCMYWMYGAYKVKE